MAFCNSCGANLEAGSRFCSKCGVVAPESGVMPAYTQPAPIGVPPSSSNPLKIILLVIGGVLLLGLIGSAVATYIGLHIAHNTRIEDSDGNVKVQGPFGTVETTKDPEQAAKDLGIDVYPGAQALREGAASVNIAGSRTVAANFQTDDPPEKVAEFYKAKFPSAKIAVSDGKRYSIISMETKHIVTIHIEPEGSKTLIHIANVNGNAVVDTDSKD